MEENFTNNPHTIEPRVKVDEYSTRVLESQSEGEVLEPVEYDKSETLMHLVILRQLRYKEQGAIGVYGPTDFHQRCAQSRR